MQSLRAISRTQHVNRLDVYLCSVDCVIPALFNGVTSLGTAHVDDTLTELTPGQFITNALQ